MRDGAPVVVLKEVPGSAPRASCIGPLSLRSPAPLAALPWQGRFAGSPGRRSPSVRRTTWSAKPCISPTLTAMGSKSTATGRVTSGGGMTAESGWQPTPWTWRTCFGKRRASRNSPDALPPGTRTGHVHLQVSDVQEAVQFYHGILGFDIVAAWQGAAFLSAGGYHHHIGLNSWGSRGAPPAPPGANGPGVVCYQGSRHGRAVASCRTAARSRKSRLRKPTAFFAPAIRGTSAWR